MAKHGTLLDLERCPHCNVDRPHLSRNHDLVTKDFRGRNERVWGFYVCTRCGGVISAWSPKGSVQIQEMYPKPIEVDEALPERAREYLEQAISSISAPAGSVMLTASAVDAMLKSKGLEEGSLYSRINIATEIHLITQQMSEWAHEVRLDANEQRHSDNSATLPSEADALRSIEFAQALASFLFVLPARVQRGLQEAHDS